MKIGELEVVRESRQVLRAGVAVRLGSRAFDLLQLLLDANGAVIPTDEILAKIWPSTVVEENNIQVHICSLRRLLGENRHLIQTVSGRGYRMARPKAVPAESRPVATGKRSPDALPRPDLGLPLASGPLFGRDICVEKLIAAISGCEDNVITLAGPAGVGKSRLAQEVARYFADRGELDVAYLSLAAQTSPRDAYDLIGAALEPADEVSRAGVRPAAGPAALLVLDNCDRLSDAVIHALSDSAAFRQRSRTVVLLTTRTPLRVSMEKVINIPSLLAVPPRTAVNAALEMFVSRVRCFDPRIDTSGAFLDSARHLVEQMDGLPLAIELAAYHTSMLGIESVALLLEQNVDLSSSDMRRMTETRHKSLGAALMWTWPDLGGPPQTVLAGLLDAGAEADLGELRSIAERSGLHPDNALEAISDLAESSFVIRAYTGSSVTYRIPNTVRRFLRQRRQAVPPATTAAGLRGLAARE